MVNNIFENLIATFFPVKTWPHHHVSYKEGWDDDKLQPVLYLSEGAEEPSFFTQEKARGICRGAEEPLHFSRRPELPHSFPSPESGRLMQQHSQGRGCLL